MKNLEKASFDSDSAIPKVFKKNIPKRDPTKFRDVAGPSNNAKGPKNNVDLCQIRRSLENWDFLGNSGIFRNHFGKRFANIGLELYDSEVMSTPHHQK